MRAKGTLLLKAAAPCPSDSGATGQTWRNRELRRMDFHRSFAFSHSSNAARFEAASRLSSEHTTIQNMRAASLAVALRVGGEIYRWSRYRRFGPPRHLRHARRGRQRARSREAAQQAAAGCYRGQSAAAGRCTGSAGGMAAATHVGAAEGLDPGELIQGDSARRRSIRRRS